jgi:hypothetical protein
VTDRGSAALTALTAELIDYAGLFPPATLGMAEAVASYAGYRSDPHRAMLGRFVVPVARLAEFAAAAMGDRAARTPNEAWRLAALTGPDPASDARCIAEFNARYQSDALIDAVEAKATTPDHIATTARALASLDVYIEVPTTQDPAPLIAELARAGARAKIRTGGVSADAFPSAAQVARFIAACHTARVPFKATAGLHHPLRGTYRLTYEPASPSATMHGFLNVFLAAAFVRAGCSESDATAILTETGPNPFRFDDAGITWRAHSLTTAQLHDARSHFALAFGSCSFREPVDDLTSLGLL